MRVLAAPATIVIAMALSCSGTPEKPAAPVALSEQEEPLEIGAVLPFTGDEKNYGLSARIGIETAVKDIGKVNGRPLKVTFLNDRSNRTQVNRLVTELTTEHDVPLIMGSAASDVTSELCRIAAERQITVITPISSASRVAQQCQPYLFRLCPSDWGQAKAMVEWLSPPPPPRPASASRPPKVAVVWEENNSWARGLADDFQQQFVGGTIVIWEALPEDADEATCLRALQRVAGTKPDALYIITYQQLGVQLLRARTAARITLPTYGGDVWATQAFLDAAGAHANSVRVLLPKVTETPSYHDFKDQLKCSYEHLNCPGQRHVHPTPPIKKNGIPVDYKYAAYAYDMTRIAARALARQDSGPALRNEISAMTHDGVTGNITFDAVGNRRDAAFERVILPNLPNAASPLH
jgi:ABC-type branched-subunit amino acid transport system substrate-binding protein